VIGSIGRTPSWRTFKAGDLWIEYPGVVHAAGNRTSDTATVVVSFLMPRGGRLTSIVP